MRAHELQHLSRSTFKQASGIVLGLAGAAWTAATGDVIGGVLAGGAGAAAASSGGPIKAEAFSYLFRSTVHAHYY